MREQVMCNLVVIVEQTRNKRRTQNLWVRVVWVDTFIDVVLHQQQVAS